MANIIGLVGVIMLLVAYTYMQSEKWDSKAHIFDLVNFMGGAIMIVYALLLSSLPLLILFIVWTGIAAKDVLASLRK